VQLSNFFLSSVQNNKDNTLIMNYGSDDKNVWTMIPKASSKTTTDSIANYNAQYIVLKDNILINQSQIKAEIICIEEIKSSLDKLQNIIKNNFNNIKDHAYKIINNDTIANITSPTNVGQLPVPNYDPSITIQEFESEKDNKEEFMDFFQILAENERKRQEREAQLAREEQAIQNARTEQAKQIEDAQKAEKLKQMSMSINDKNTVINNIINMKNNYLQELESDISNINILLTLIEVLVIFFLLAK
jgi:hypothetical protein